MKNLMSSEAEQRQPLIIDPESDARRRRTEKSSNEGMWGLVFLIIALAAFVLQSEVAQYLQGPNQYYKPWFILYVAHSSYTLFMPLQMAYFYLRRESSTDAEEPRSYWGYVAGLARGLFEDECASDLQIVSRVILRSVLMTVVFTSGSICWYISVSRIPMGDVTAIYNTSCFFTYILSALVLGESIETMKIMAVGLSVAGIALICLVQHPETPHNASAGSTAGYIAATCASFLVAVYEVLYSKLLVPKQPSSFFSLHVTSMVGLVTLILGLPVFPLLHYTKLEVFEWPSQESQGYIAIVTLLGIGFNATFMLVMAFIGPVLAAVGILMTIPLTTIVDSVITGQQVGLNTVSGSAAIFTAFAMMHWAKKK